MSAEPKFYVVGEFKVLEQVRPDNPSWPVYVVLQGTRMVGRSFSRPSEADCRTMLRESRERLAFAEPMHDASAHRRRGLRRAHSMRRGCRR